MSDNEAEEQEQQEVAKIGIEGKEIPLTSLSPQQLVQLRQQLTVEINQLSQNLSNLNDAAARFQGSEECVSLAAKSEEKTPMLVPLCGSVYVDGYTTKQNDLLVDVGTGYYCQKSHEATVGFLSEKRTQITENCRQIESAIKQKKEVLMQLMQVLGPMEAQAKAQQATAAQAAA